MTEKLYKCTFCDRRVCSYTHKDDDIGEFSVQLQVAMFSKTGFKNSNIAWGCRKCVGRLDTTTILRYITTVFKQEDLNARIRHS